MPTPISSTSPMPAFIASGGQEDGVLDDTGTDQAPKKLFVDLAESDDDNDDENNKSKKKSTDEDDAPTDTQLSDDPDNIEQTKDNKNAN
jgi:hypothetical protein